MITGIISSEEIKDRYGIGRRTFSNWRTLPGFPQPVTLRPLRFRTPEIIAWAARNTPEYLPRILNDTPSREHPEGRPIKAANLDEQAPLALTILSLAGYAIKQSTSADVGGFERDQVVMQVSFTPRQLSEATNFFIQVSNLHSQNLRKFMLGLLAGSTPYQMEKRMGVSRPTRQDLTEKAIKEVLEIIYFYEIEALTALAKEVYFYGD